jgi:hypothetical protein
MENLFRILLVRDIQKMKVVIKFNSFFHVYREIIMEVDSLSKEGF